VKYLVDTDWVADYLAGQTAAIRLINSLFRDGAAISIISYSEIQEGILGSYDPRAARQGFRRLLRSVRVLPITRPIADRNAAIRSQLRSQNKPIDPRAFDLLIAATALEYRLTLVTRNTRHYGDIPGIQLYQPP
jgi:tRNA(fMet)-specific endonuclease VapC